MSVCGVFDIVKPVQKSGKPCAWFIIIYTETIYFCNEVIYVHF